MTMPLSQLYCAILSPGHLRLSVFEIAVTFGQGVRYCHQFPEREPAEGWSMCVTTEIRHSYTCHGCKLAIGENQNAHDRVLLSNRQLYASGVSGTSKPDDVVIKLLHLWGYVFLHHSSCDKVPAYMRE